MATVIKYSVVVPVYNRPLEVEELLESLSVQTLKNFEVLIVEDGSDDDCKDVIAAYQESLSIRYWFKANSGPGDSRNFGMAKADGEYIIFFDSDCLIPEFYFERLTSFLEENPLDAFGGPDSAHESFTTIQKAINYAMTSVLTTGGVRGKENKLDNYQPRSFNMGIKKSVYEDVGGFSDIHPGEDPDLSYRIMNAGYKIGLVEDAFVYHKRRIDFSKFAKQVYKFGVVRNVLNKWYPDKTKLVYTLPSLFLLGSIILVLGSVLSCYSLFPLDVLAIIFFLDALRVTRNLVVSILAVPASFLQLWCYGYGYLKGWLYIHFLKKEERIALKSFFFKS